MTKTRKTKQGNDVKPGDVILFLGTPHLIETIEPYTHPTVPECFAVARASDGWGITLTTGPVRYEVA